jgi:hypothetical protein
MSHTDSDRFNNIRQSKSRSVSKQFNNNQHKEKMATSDKKVMAFDVDIGSGHQKGNPQDERIRQHLEQEAKEVPPSPLLPLSLLPLCRR